LAGYVDVFNQQVTAELQATLQIKASREAFILQGIQNTTQLLLNKIQAHTQGIELLRQINLDQMRGELEARIREKVSRDAFILQSGSVLSSLKQSEWEMDRFWMGMYTDLYKTLVAAGLQVELAEKAARDALG